MPPFPRPNFVFQYNPDVEIAALRSYRDTAPGRAIPRRRKNRLLVATWNIANLGVQDRRPDDYRLLAEILSWFDVVAVQEVNEKLDGLRAIQGNLPDSWRVLFSDAGGNRERMTFIYDAEKLSLLEEIGEVSLPPSDYPDIKLDGVEKKFNGFNRNPYLATFVAGDFTFSLVNVHSIFGSKRATDMDRRRLETYAIARWADLRQRRPDWPTGDVIPLGDFNLPKIEKGDPIYDALVSRGLHLADHSTKIGSSVTEDGYYDHVAFFPGQTANDFTGESGVFDFDGGVFADLWKDRPKEFTSYLRYYLSDHRPMWAEFSLQAN